MRVAVEQASHASPGGMAGGAGARATHGRSMDASLVGARATLGNISVEGSYSSGSATRSVWDSS